MFELSRTSIVDPHQEQHRHHHNNKTGHNYQLVPTTVTKDDELPFSHHQSPARKKNDDLVVESSLSVEPPVASLPVGEQSVPKSPTQSSSENPTNPSLKYCSFCERQVLTTVELQPSVWCFVVSFLMFMSFGWITFCILPFIWPLLQLAIHHCPLCYDILDKKSRVSCVKLRDEVITIRCGSCAIVLSRTYILVFGIMLTLIMSVMSLRWYLNIYGLPDIPKGDPSPASWNEFLESCGMRSLLGNPVRAENKFETEFMDKTVTWYGGRMHHIQQGILGKHFMYLDMDPRQYHRSDLRDLALIFGKGLLEKVTQLEVGDILSFETTLIELGKRGRPHLGILWDFNVTAKAGELPVHDDEPASRFFILRNHLGRPPVDLGLFLQHLRNAQQSLREKQDASDTLQLFLPFGDVGFPSIHVIRNVNKKPDGIEDPVREIFVGNQDDGESPVEQEMDRNASFNKDESQASSV